MGVGGRLCVLSAWSRYQSRERKSEEIMVSYFCSALGEKHTGGGEGERHAEGMSGGIAVSFIETLLPATSLPILSLFLCGVCVCVCACVHTELRHGTVDLHRTLVHPQGDLDVCVCVCVCAVTSDRVLPSPSSLLSRVG